MCEVYKGGDHDVPMPGCSFVFPILVGVFSSEVGTLDGAREAMGKDEIDAWLWEKFTTKHLVDNGESWPRMVWSFFGGDLLRISRWVGDFEFACEDDDDEYTMMINW